MHARTGHPTYGEEIAMKAVIVPEQLLHQLVVLLAWHAVTFPRSEFARRSMELASHADRLRRDSMAYQRRRSR